MDRTSCAAVTIAVLAAWPAPVRAAPTWSRSDTGRCRVHWSDATPWAARRVIAACDRVVAAADPEAARVDVVVEDRHGLAYAQEGVARVPAAPADDRWVGGPPTLEAALARAVGEALAGPSPSPVRLELTVHAQDPRGVDAGGRLTLGGAGQAPWRRLGQARLHAERAGGAGWTTARDALLRVAVREGELPSPAELELPSRRGGVARRLAAVQGYSLARFQAERHDAGAGAEALAAMHPGWVERARAVYADQVEAIGEEVGGRPVDGPVADAWSMRGAELRGLRLSPDGAHLAWVDGPEGRVVAVRPPDERPPRTLRFPAAGGLDWAPDARRLVAADGQLRIVELPAGEVRRLTEGLSAVDPAWSPEGGRIAFVHRRDGLSRLGLLDPEAPEDGITWILAPTDGAWIGHPDWSADGRWLVFEMHRGGRWDLWAIGRGGGDLRPLTWDDARERDPVIDPRGRAVWYASDATGVFDIRRLDLLTGRVERITRVHGAALAPFVASGALYYLHLGPAGLSPRWMAAPAVLERAPGPRPGSLEVARSLLPAPPPPAPEVRQGWPMLPLAVTPQAVWDEALSAGIRLEARGPGRGPVISAGALLGSASSVALDFDSGGPAAAYLRGRWLSLRRPLSVAGDPDGDPASLQIPLAVATDGQAAWWSGRAGGRWRLGSGAGVELFLEGLHAEGDGRLDADGAARIRRVGVGGALALKPPGGWGALELTPALLATDLDRPIWDGAEVLGRSDAAGGAYDYAYARVTAEGRLRIPAPWLSEGGRQLRLRVRGGWIGRNVAPEEELFAGVIHPADRFRPDRAQWGLAAYPKFAVRGETLLLAGLSWRTPLGDAWRGTAGVVALDGGWLELFADAGNAWGHSARWQRTAGGALVVDGAGRPTPVPGTVARDDPLRDPGAAGPRLLTEVGVRLGLAVRLLHAPWGSTLGVAYGFQPVRGRGDPDGDGVAVRPAPLDPLAAEEAPAGLRVALSLGTGLP